MTDRNRRTNPFTHIPEIGGKYDSFVKISEGGMGEIYRVRHKFLDELRVIKTIKSDTRSPDARRRFIQEARIAAKLRHPNIASIYDFVLDEDEKSYIVMEYIDGRNLFDHYHRGDRLSQSQIAACGRQILDALDYLHSENFIHRDLALDNIMVTRGRSGESVFKLIDLGLAKSLDTVEISTQSGIALGKVSYISPEELIHGSGDERIDHRADLYSFGVVLYHLLTGELPIEGSDQASMIAGHLYRPPKSFDITDPRHELSQPVRQVLLRALEKEPDDRYASARELAEALEAAMPTGDGPPQAQDVLGHPPAPRPAERLPLHESFGALLPKGFEARLALAAFATFFGVLAIWFLLARVLPRDSSEAAASDVSTASSLDPSTADAAADELSQAEAPFYGDYYALVIGNDRYQRINWLESAVEDAREVSRLLASKYGFQVKTLENATRKETLDALWDLTRTVDGRGNVLIYYAGHGFRHPSGQQYWQPIDASPDDWSNWISTEYDVSDYIQRSKARHVLVIADSCYAGSAGTLSPSALDEGDQVLKRSRLVLTSGSLQPVVDSGGDGHSIFARVLIDALRENEKPLSVFDLFQDSIATEVPRLAARIDVEQTPTLNALSMSADEGGLFYFVPREGDTPSVSG